MIHVGFDIGGTNIKAGLVNDQGRIQVKRNVPFPRESVQACVDTLDSLIKDMLNELNLTVEDIADIGIAVPGSIDPSWSVVVNAYNLGFHDVPLKAMVSELYPGIPVALANDANAAALAELYGGAFDGKKTAVLLTLGTGVGGGMILNGAKIRRGQRIPGDPHWGVGKLPLAIFLRQVEIQTDQIYAGGGNGIGTAAGAVKNRMGGQGISMLPNVDLRLAGQDVKDAAVPDKHRVALRFVMYDFSKTDKGGNIGKEHILSSISL